MTLEISKKNMLCNIYNKSLFFSKHYYDIDYINMLITPSLYKEGVTIDEFLLVKIFLLAFDDV